MLSGAMPGAVTRRHPSPYCGFVTQPRFCAAALTVEAQQEFFDSG
jgi:hypothetical protein